MLNAVYIIAAAAWSISSRSAHLEPPKPLRLAPTEKAWLFDFELKDEPLKIKGGLRRQRPPGCVPSISCQCGQRPSEASMCRRLI